MTGIAAILASLLSLVVAVPLARCAEYLDSVPDYLQVLAIIGGIGFYIAIWIVTFNFLCNISGVGKW